MTIRTTRWKPDTCECVLEYEWDDSLPIDQITYSLFNIKRRCLGHQELSTDTDVWNVVKEENPRKNEARKLLLDNAPSAIYDIINTQTGERDFKNDIGIIWSWTGTAPNRVLNIVVTGYSLTQNQKNSIQAKLDQRFGISNVTIS